MQDGYDSCEETKAVIKAKITFDEVNYLPQISTPVSKATVG